MSRRKQFATTLVMVICVAKNSELPGSSRWLKSAGSKKRGGDQDAPVANQRGKQWLLQRRN